MSKTHYRLKKRGEIHAVKNGKQYTLCGTPIKKGERGRNLLWYGQISCATCKKAFALAPDRFRKKVGV
jgi:hypothetical protein